jgi:2-polyprenyl-3-methyl-5-hydroxy-6-metoxy-1,4-benzoquinol methylase
MPFYNLRDQIEHVDIYLLDQILKGRYLKEELILDAGCGTGRNLKWFYNNGYTLFGVDANEEYINYVKSCYTRLEANFTLGTLESLMYKSETFHHVICNAVLHFAKSEARFLEMFSELIRVLKPNGTLFIRMTSNFGIEEKVEEISKGVYNLPDKSERFLLTKPILKDLSKRYNLEFIEPVKTLNVQDLRCMTTLMLIKK